MFLMAAVQPLFHSPRFLFATAPFLFFQKGQCQKNNANLSLAQKSYSSTLRGMPGSLRNGIISDPDLVPRRNSLILKAKPDPPPPPTSQDHGAEQYFREWFSKPADLHGVILPHVSGTHVKLWKLCYFRWVPEAQIHLGGFITAFHKLSLLADEVDTLSRTLRQHRAGSLDAGHVGPDESRMYFRVSAHATPGTPDFLSSAFPFSPVGNLCRRSISGTPLSKFLSGAKIWLSTETLANED